MSPRAGAVLRIAQPVVWVVEPHGGIHGESVGYRLAARSELVDVVERSLRGARIWLADGGALAVHPHPGCGPGGECLALVGSWRRDGTGVWLSAARCSPAGAWRTFDGLLREGALRAAYVDNSIAWIAYLEAETASVEYPEPLAVPEPFDAVGLPHAAPVAALDVDWPFFELIIRPDGNRGEELKAQLSLIHYEPDRFGIMLLSHDNLIHFSDEHRSCSRDIQGSRITVRHQRDEVGKLRWRSGDRELRLDEIRLVVDFDADQHTVAGSITGRSAAADIIGASFQGTLQGRAVQRLRERMAIPNADGRWVTVIGPPIKYSLATGSSTEPPATPLPGTNREPEGIVRLATALDLLVGLHVSTGDAEFVALRRVGTETTLAPEFSSVDRHALRYLVQDLCMAGRAAEALPLLSRAVTLLEESASASPPRASDESDLISLLILIDTLMPGTHLLQPYPNLVGLLEREMAARTQLTSSAAVYRRYIRMAADTIGQTQSMLDLVRDLAHGLHQAIGASGALGAPSERAAAALVAALDGAAALLAEISAVATTVPQGSEPNDVRAAVDALDSLIGLAVDPDSGLPALATRCLAEDAELFVSIPDLVRERESFVRAVDGGAGPRPDELDAINEREQRLSAAVRGSDQLTQDTAQLFLLQQNAAITLDSAANQMRKSRDYLRKADPAGSLIERRQQVLPASMNLSTYVERRRGQLDQDRDRIEAVDEALRFHDAWVGLLLDGGAVEQAWVASELARARATADLLTAGPAAELSLAMLRTAVAELGNTVVQYFIREHELVAWVVPPTGPLRCVRHQVRADDLADAVQRLHTLAAIVKPTPATQREFAELLRWLYTQLWAPLPMEALPSDPDETITIIPHLHLFLVPIAGLTDPHGRALVHLHNLTQVPAVALVPLLARSRPDDHGGPLLALVDPEPMPPGLGQLTRTRLHIHRITDLFEPAAVDLWVGRQASVQRLRELHRAPSVVLLATHGQTIDTGDPMSASFVALAPSDQHDGLVRPDDLVGLALPGPVVILSACHTAGGRITGDGVDGLSRAFLIGGASALILTLYQVTERVAGDLVYEFLTRWRSGDTVERAFRTAQLEIAEQDPNDPALWIPFTLYGLGR
ncbi:MAG: CHAT domain-containing protein [Pseudonocardia sp.]|nr:CHAT domain-containing protein [Pseudonocardia sp.]